MNSLRKTTVLTLGLWLVVCLIIVAKSTVARTPDLPLEPASGWNPYPAGRLITMEEAIRMALGANAELAAARSVLAQARADILSSKAYPNPELGFGAAPSVPSASDLSLTLEIDQPISIRNKIAKRVDLATKELERDEWFVHDRERSITAQVRSTYRSAQVINQRATLSRSLVDLNKRLLVMARARFNRGEVSELDIRQFQVELARRQQEVKSLSASRASALIGLATLLNIPYEDGLTISEQLAGDTRAFPVDPFLEAIANRPDLKGIQAESSAATKEITLRIAERRENPRIGLFYTRDRGQFDNPITITDTDNIFGIRVSIPLPLWYKNQGGIARAKARARTAVATYQAQLLNVDRQVRDAHQRAMAQLDIINALEKGVEAAENGRRLAEQTYGQGLIGAVQLIQAQQQLFNITDARLDAIESYYQALSDLEGAVDASADQVLHSPREKHQP